MNVRALSWKKVPQYGNRYAFAVQGSRPMSESEFREFCDYNRETFGPGGVLPEYQSCWTVSYNYDWFAFSKEQDMIVFILYATK